MLQADFINQHGHIHWILPPTVRCQNNLSQPTSRVEFHNSNLRIHRYKVSPKPKSNSPQPQHHSNHIQNHKKPAVSGSCLRCLAFAPRLMPRNLRILLQDIDATVSHVRLVADRQKTVGSWPNPRLFLSIFQGLKMRNDAVECQ